MGNALMPFFPSYTVGMDSCWYWLQPLEGMGSTASSNKDTSMPRLVQSTWAVSLHIVSASHKTALLPQVDKSAMYKASASNFFYQGFFLKPLHLQLVSYRKCSFFFYIIRKDLLSNIYIYISTYQNYIFLGKIWYSIKCRFAMVRLTLNKFKAIFVRWTSWLVSTLGGEDF